MYNMISTTMHLTITCGVGVGFHAGTRSNIRNALAQGSISGFQKTFLAPSGALIAIPTY